MNLLQRIDLALQHARKTRPELAAGIGISTQSISNLKRRPRSTMRPENVARAARWLGCDVYWLCTGEPPHYVPANTAAHSFLALEVARWLDAMAEPDRARAFAFVYQMAHGTWPPGNPSDDATGPRPGGSD